VDQVPILYVLAGPNGAGKSTFVERVLQPKTHLSFVNADVIAAATWPAAAGAQAYAAAALAAEERQRLLIARESFITETVFSHRNKLDLLTDAKNAGYHTSLHVMLIPEDLSVARVAHRVRRGGHDVPEDKIRTRHRRLWALVARARGIVDEACFYDNSLARTPFRPVATYERGRPVGVPQWPDWAPPELT